MIEVDKSLVALFLQLVGFRARDAIAIADWLEQATGGRKEPGPAPAPARRRTEASEETIDEVARRLEAGDFTPEDLQRWAKKFGLKFGRK